MRVAYGACCETVIQDSRSNNLSLINLIDEIQAVAFPIIVPKLCFVALIERTPDETPASQARLVGKLNDSVVFSFELPIDFQGKMKTRAVAQFQGILIQGPGILSISLSVGGQDLSTVQIEVKHVGNPQAELFTGLGQMQPL